MRLFTGAGVDLSNYLRILFSVISENEMYDNLEFRKVEESIGRDSVDKVPNVNILTVNFIVK